MKNFQQLKKNLIQFNLLEIFFNWGNKIIKLKIKYLTMLDIFLKLKKYYKKPIETKEAFGNDYLEFESNDDKYKYFSLSQ